METEQQGIDRDTANMEDYCVIFEAVESTLIGRGLDHGGRGKDEKRERGGASGPRRLRKGRKARKGGALVVSEFPFVPFGLVCLCRAWSFHDSGERRG